MEDLDQPTQGGCQVDLGAQGRNGGDRRHPKRRRRGDMRQGSGEAGRLIPLLSTAIIVFDPGIVRRLHLGFHATVAVDSAGHLDGNRTHCKGVLFVVFLGVIPFVADATSREEDLAGLYLGGGTSVTRRS